MGKKDRRAAGMPTGRAPLSPRAVGWALGLICVLALGLRLLPAYQSLWYDEMYTMQNFIAQPWGHVLGFSAPAGQRVSYSPNNHVLFTILAKLVSPDDRDATLEIRLPSILAGALTPLVLAWPLRKERPGASLLLAVLVALHPWHVAFSAYARGYALLLLLAALATHCIPRRRAWLDWRYALLAAGAIYTHPLGVLVLPGNALWALWRGEARWTFVRSAAAGAVIALLLYAPFLRGLGGSVSEGAPSLGFAELVQGTLRHVQAGYDAGGIVNLLLPALVLIAGTVVAWRGNLLRQTTLCFAGMTLAGALLAVFYRPAGEVRAMLWLVPLYCIGATALLGGAVGEASQGAPGSRWGGWTMRLASYALMALMLVHVHYIAQTPAQPIRDAIMAAREEFGESAVLIGVDMGAAEAHFLYMQPGRTRGLDGYAYKLEKLREIEDGTPGRKLAVLVFYEAYMDREPHRQEMRRHLRENYREAMRLPGRISPAVVYLRNGAMKSGAGK